LIVRVSVDAEVDRLAKIANVLEQREPSGVAAVEPARCSAGLDPQSAAAIPAALANTMAPSIGSADFGYRAEEVRANAGHVAQNSAMAPQPR
jgi:hypothetical protein